jgi:WD40 repeat protein
VGRSDGSIGVVDLETGKPVREFAPKVQMPLALATTADGRRAFSGGRPDTFARQWDVDTGREISRSDPLTAPADSLAVSADGRRVLLLCGNFLFVWDADKGPKVRLLHTTVPVGNMPPALSPDGKRALFASGKTFWLYDVEADQAVGRFEPAQQPVLLAFTPDGRSALAASAGMELQAGKLEPIKSFLWLYDLERRVQRHQFEGHLGPIHCLALTPDGRRIVSGGRDQTVRVWQMPAR